MGETIKKMNREELEREYVLKLLENKNLRKISSYTDKELGDVVIRQQENIKRLEEENKKLKEKVRFLEECLDRKEKVNKSLREDIDNGFNRETDLRNKRADSLLENKDLRDKIEELETDYDRLKVAFEDVVSGE